MIYIIGTAHTKTQFWSDAIRDGSSLDTCAAVVEHFEAYLREAANSLRAKVMAEENSQHMVLRFEGGSSVAKKVAGELRMHHVYCDPDPSERQALNIQTNDDRETVWMQRIRPFSPNEISIVLICGADHSRTFRALLERNGLHAQIYCQDWMIWSGEEIV
jgi:hypothetical protein